MANISVLYWILLDEPPALIELVLHRMTILYTPLMRIASLSPAATEIVCALGLGKDIVCTDQFSNFPDEVKGLPHLKDHQKIAVQDLRPFAPDVVLTGTVIQERLAAELKAAGLPVFHQDPRTLAQVYEAIVALGILLEREELARGIVREMEERLHRLQTKVKLLPAKARVYVEEWHLPPMVSGNWVPEIIRAAGGTSFPIEAGTLSREVMLEEVQKFDPDLIVISWCGAGKLAEKKLFM